MENIVLPLASKAAEYLVAPICRQCGYVIFPNSYVHQLKDEVEKLSNARDRVQHSVNAALNNMKQIEADVERWMKNVETVANKARDVLDFDRRAKKTCFYGWLPNPKARYCLGKEASKTVKDTRAFIAQGQFEKVDFERPPPGLVVGASDVNSLAGGGNNTITDSRASIFQGIMKALDDKKLKVIGVYGPGGVGKTTLLEEAEKILRKEGRPFHMIVKSKVSQNPDLKKIQDDIAYAFGLKLKDEPSEVGRRVLLYQRLRKDPSEKVLIILDDLWGELDLKAVGIPSGEESRGSKLLLSSRFKDVLEKIHADQIFHLEGLRNDEAFRLFEKTVGDKLKDKELQQIAAKLVKKLAGLPLLIISVASTLRHSDVSAWKNALIKIDESNIETIVKLSYDHLKTEEAKSLFLLCGLIGGTIPVESLLVLGLGLGLFEGFDKTIQDARDRLNTMLNELRSACLLLDGGNDKDNVTIHDLYSEIVVSSSFRGHNSLMMNSNYGLWSKEKLEKCWAICQVNVGSDELAELMLSRFPELKILILSQSMWDWMPAHRHGERDCCRLDFTYMKELQVLYLICMHITRLPSSIEILKNLRSLCLDHCDVGDVAILGKLKALQILSFVGSKISKLPKEIGKLTNLRSLNLSKCKNLQIIESGVLKNLIKLEELHMKESFDQWMGKDEIPSEFCNAALSELKSLRKIASLEISIPNPTILLEDADLPFEQLIKFWINIGNVGGREFKGLTTMKLKLEGNDSILSKEWVHKTLHKTQYLHLDGFGEFKKNAHKLCIQGFPQLKHLDIMNTSSIKYIASSSNDPFLTPFTILESLFLENIINLEKICNGPVAPDCFSKLKALSIKKCHRLENLWFLSEMQRLEQLEEIHVCECDSLKAIITNDAGKVEVAADGIVELPNLYLLELHKLPNMTGFCSRAEGAPIQAGVVDEGGGDEGTELIPTTSDLHNTYSNSFFNRKVSLPNMDELTLDSVGSFKRIWHDELSRSSFCTLATITIENCSDLLHIFPSTIIGRLHNVESVKVKNCPSLKSLFDCGSLDSNMEQTTILIPKLQEVSVSGAKRLRHMVMSDSQTILDFPSLETVRVENCSDLRYLFPNYIATTLVKLESLEITKCEQMKEVILEKEVARSEEQVMSFPCLSELTLEELDNLICFSSGNCSYDFASLEDLKIVGCCNFGAFILSPTNVKRQLGETVILSPTNVKRQLGETAEENDELPQLLFNEMVTFPNITSLRIEGIRCKELWNNQIPIDSFQNLKFFELKDCYNLQRIAPSNMWKRLQCCLKILKVISCRSIEIIYEGDEIDTKGGKLKGLVLHDLENLRHIWRSDGLPNVPFPNLRHLKVVRCPRLEMLFPTFTENFLEQIEELVVESCEDMELIAGHEKSEDATGTTITFSKLTTLTLFDLLKFRSFVPEKYSLKSLGFPCLRECSMISCGARPSEFSQIFSRVRPDPDPQIEIVFIYHEPETWSNLGRRQMRRQLERLSKRELRRQQRESIQQTFE